MPVDTFASPGNHTWTVPDGVEYVILRCWGAGTQNGGDGGLSQGTVSVTPGQTLDIRVGGQGVEGNEILEAGVDEDAGGFPNGGGAGATEASTAYGGGGSTDVRHPASSRSDDILILAGGGGGDPATHGGGAFSMSSSGVDGGGALDEGQDSQTAGEGATIAQGATGGGSGSFDGGNGSSSQSSQAGGDDQASGGGGGGGLNGGEGGNVDISNFENEVAASGGAGGDGYQDPALTNTSTAIGDNTGHGTVEIEYSPEVDDLSASPGSEDEIDLSWSRPSSETEGYGVYRAQSSGSSTGDYSQVTLLSDPSNTNYTDSGLEDGERYYYRILSTYSGEDDVLGNEANAVTVLPQATNVQTAFSSGDVDVTWQNNDDSSDGGIDIERRQVPNGSWSTVTSGLSPGTTSDTDTTVTQGRTYDYRIERNTDHASATSTVSTVGVGGFIIKTLNSVRETVDSVFVTE